MSHLIIEHSFLNLLRLEHRQIEHHLDLMLQNMHNKQHVEWLWQNAELIHHYKEETILFEYLAQNYTVQSGGPMCMFFLDYYVAHPPLEKCKTVTGVIPELEEHQKLVFNSGSTMRVPMNEHRAGKEILKFTMINWNVLDVLERERNLKLYNEIQREHLNKEENCFFHLCASLLNVSEADLLLEKWNHKA